MPASAAAAKLREFGEEDAAEALESELGEGGAAAFGPIADLIDLLPGRDKLYLSRTHAFGYIKPAPAASGDLPIRHAGNIEADQELKDARVVIRLDRLRVAAYPGGGTHHVLFEFSARHHADQRAEDLHFSTTCRVREGEEAAMVGYPIFVGLGVGAEGLAFQCRTVNVKNENDQGLLGFLDSGVFKAGLTLASTFQPAIGPLSEMALGLCKAMAARANNALVQEFSLGLDFSPIPTGARLAEGSYLAVQIPAKLELALDWGDWVFDSARGQIVNTTDRAQTLPYNYLVFSVSRYDGP